MTEPLTVVTEYGLALCGLLALAFFVGLALEDLWTHRKGKGKHRGI